MPELITQSSFADLFLNDIPLLDVRAPAEFAHGAFPRAVNFPLLSDAERQAIGIRYKQAGQDAAVSLGHELVSGATREQRVADWLAFLAENPSALLYCFRGGLRSSVVQQWLDECGIKIPRIAGGYKALRRFLIDELDKAGRCENFIIVGGKTGSGKTHLINQLQSSVDLEACAQHRGSAFGRRTIPQPSQINFENVLSVAFLKLPYKLANRIFLEDESRAIGSLSLPLALHESMRQAPIAIIEETIQSRVDTVLNDYIQADFLDFQQLYPEDFKDRFNESLLSSLDRIRRRLGDENYRAVKQSMAAAQLAQDQHEAMHLHRLWITCLLKNYYDPMYDYQLNKKGQRVVFRGNRAEFLTWAGHLDTQLAS